MRPPHLNLHESPEESFERETTEAETWFQEEFRKAMTETMGLFDEQVAFLQRELRAKFFAIRKKYYPH
jgi:hypothetical protein